MLPVGEMSAGGRILTDVGRPYSMYGVGGVAVLGLLCGMDKTDRDANHACSQTPGSITRIGAYVSQ